MKLAKRPRNINPMIKKFKLKTKSAMKKRVRVVGGLRNRGFKYHSVGHRHLNRNKSWRNRKAFKRRHIVTNMMDQKKIRRMMPYWKK